MKSIPASILAALAALFACGIAAPVTAQEPPAAAPEAAVSAELARIEASLDEIAGLLRRQLETRRLELMMRRVEMAQARLTPLEQALRGAREQRASAAEQKRQIEAQIEGMARRIDEDDEFVQDMPEYEIRHFTDEMTLQLRLVIDRLRDLDLRIVEIENEISDHRRVVVAWQDLVDRRLLEEQREEP